MMRGSRRHKFWTIATMMSGGVAPPAAPENLAVTGASGGVVADLTPELTADAVAGATSYDFEIATTGNLTGTPTATGQPTPAYTFGSQTNHYAYDLAIRSVNAGGVSEWATTTVHISAFTQALGAEVLPNPGNPYAFDGGGDPTGFTIDGQTRPDPEVTEVDSGQLHGGTDATGGALNWYSSVTNFAPNVYRIISPQGKFYDIRFYLSARSAGVLYYEMGGQISGSWSNTGVEVNLQGMASSDRVSLKPFTGGGNFTLDYFSLKEITPNAVVTVGADGSFDFFFTLPASPKPLQNIMLIYRVSGALSDGNFWVARLQRNSGNSAWDVRLDKVSSRTPTNVINVTGVGTPNGLRIVTLGNDHSLYTTANSGGSWTQRGTTQSDGTHATADGITTLYTPEATPIQLGPLVV